MDGYLALVPGRIQDIGRPDIRQKPGGEFDILPNAGYQEKYVSGHIPDIIRKLNLISGRIPKTKNTYPIPKLEVLE